jgi:hypothetical protein
MLRTPAVAPLYAGNVTGPNSNTRASASTLRTLAQNSRTLWMPRSSWSWLIVKRVKRVKRLPFCEWLTSAA